MDILLSSCGAVVLLTVNWFFTAARRPTWERAKHRRLLRGVYSYKSKTVYILLISGKISIFYSTKIPARSFVSGPEILVDLLTGLCNESAHLLKFIRICRGIKWATGF